MAVSYTHLHGSQVRPPLRSRPDDSEAVGVRPGQQIGGNAGDRAGTDLSNDRRVGHSQEAAVFSLK